MNIIRTRQAERLERINTIRLSILKSEEPDLNRLCVTRLYNMLRKSGEWGITKRYFKELLEIAQNLIELENK